MSFYEIKRKWLIKMGFASRFASAYVSESRKDSKRRQRELEQRGKREAAADEVDVYENYIERLIGLHKESRGYINWENIVNIDPPVKPIRNSINENKAREKWESYKPGFFDRLFKWQEKRKNKLFDNIGQEKIMDDKVFKEKWGKYERDYAEWKESKEFAVQILDGNLNAYRQALEELNPLTEIIDELGSDLSFAIPNKKMIATSLHLHSESIIPSNIKSLTTTGKLSIRKMPKSRYLKIYQDHVCSCALSIAKELFSLLPLDCVVITVEDTIFNHQSGYNEEIAILSVAITRKSLESINVDTIDPTESMKIFIHNMKFKKTKGFSAINPLEPSELN